MRDIQTITDTIRQSVTARDAAQALGILVDGHGRCACPAHNGKDRNMRLYPGDGGFHCFVCGASGDVIRLVEIVLSCTFQEAVRWLDSAFGLGLELPGASDTKRSEAAQIALKRKRMRREQDRQIDQMLFDLYVMSGILLNGIEADAVRYRPVRPYGDWDRRYAEAVKMLPEAMELNERLAVEVMGKA